MTTALSSLWTGVVMATLLLSSTHAQSCTNITNQQDCASQTQDLCLWICNPNPTRYDAPDTICECLQASHIFHLDLLVLVDTACPMSTELCKRQQQEIAQTLIEIRAAEDTNPLRISYIEYSSQDTSVILDIAHDPIHVTGADSDQPQLDLYYKIRDSNACDNMTQRTGSPLLHTAILQGMERMERNGSSLELNRDQKILIYSNCAVDEDQKAKICQTFESMHQDRGKHSDINVVMVNNIYSNATEFVDPDTYMMCAVEWDVDRVFTTNIEDDYYANVMRWVQREILIFPSPAPTVDPTSLPTFNLPTESPVTPTHFPTWDPTNDPTNHPTDYPSWYPSNGPTNDPTNDPTIHPTERSTPEPTKKQQFAPTRAPNHDTQNKECPDPSNPACNPTNAPTMEPTMEPTTEPTMVYIFTVAPIVSTLSPRINQTVTDIPYDIPTPKPTDAPFPPSANLWVWIIISMLLCCYVSGVIFYALKQRKRREARAYAPAGLRHEDTSSSSDSGVGNEELQQLRIMVAEDNLYDVV